VLLNLNRTEIVRVRSMRAGRAPMAEDRDGDLHPCPGGSSPGAGDSDPAPSLVGAPAPWRRGPRRTNAAEDVSAEPHTRGGNTVAGHRILVVG